MDKENVDKDKVDKVDILDNVSKVDLVDKDKVNTRVTHFFFTSSFEPGF